VKISCKRRQQPAAYRCAGTAPGDPAPDGRSRTYYDLALIGHLLYEIDAHDPVAFVGAVVLSVGVCLFAAYAPARRVTAISPVDVLSEE
jgi:hypothetical protein